MSTVEAPRWRLTNPHYLKVFELPDGTRCEWEHKETARETGRTVRKLYPVPILLNPADASDCNYPGEIIVAHAVDGAHNLRNDIIFADPPTPEMEPLNDAAQAITDAMRPKWDHPIDALPANGGMSPQESVFMAQMMEAFAKIAPAPASAPVTLEQYNELKKEMEAMKALLAQPKAGPTSPVPERRV